MFTRTTRSSYLAVLAWAGGVAGTLGDVFIPRAWITCLAVGCWAIAGVATLAAVFSRQHSETRRVVWACRRHDDQLPDNVVKLRNFEAFGDHARFKTMAGHPPAR